jgi:hypothetical protein
MGIISKNHIVTQLMNASQPASQPAAGRSNIMIRIQQQQHQDSFSIA